MSRHRALVGALWFGALYAPAAEAEPLRAGAPLAASPRGRASIRVLSKHEGYIYEFNDDPGGLPFDDTHLCRWWPLPLRPMLTKPRVTFVPELLEAIETL